MAQQAPKDSMAELIALLKVYGNQSYHPDDGTLTISKLAVRQAEAVIDKFSAAGFSEGPNMEIRGKGTHDTTIVIRGSYIDALAKHMAFPGLRQDALAERPELAMPHSGGSIDPISHFVDVTHRLGITWQRGTGNYPVVLHVTDADAPVIAGALQHLKIEYKEQDGKFFLQSSPETASVLSGLERAGQPGLPKAGVGAPVPDPRVQSVDGIHRLAMKINAASVSVTQSEAGELTITAKDPSRQAELEAELARDHLHFSRGEYVPHKSGVAPIVISDAALVAQLLQAGVGVTEGGRQRG